MTNRVAAVDRALTQAKRAIGVYYKVDQPIYEDSLPQLKKKELCRHDVINVDVEWVLDGYE